MIGNTGYGYGDTLSVEYSERLLVNLTQQLRYLELNSSTPESVPIGKALVRAKRAYLDRAVTLTGLDEKAMEELTLYGLPMWKVALPDGRIRPAQASLQAAPPPVNPRALASVDVSPTYALALRQQATARAESSQVESYFANTSVALDHDVNPEPNDTQAVAFRPIVPRVAVNVGAEGLLARGVALLAADYDDRALFSPLVSVPVTESEGVRPSVTANEFAPDRPYALNALSQSLVVTPFQFRRRAKEPSGIARVYERDAETGAGSMLFRVYYSPMRDRAALVGPAAIVGVRLMGNDTRVRVDVTVAGAAVADLADVLLTYTAEPGPPQNSLYGHWRSCSLMPGSRALPGGNARCSLEGQPTDIAKTDTTFTRVYSAEIETAGTGARITDLRLFVQTVTGTGIVSTRTNEGAYFRVVQQTATLASPKIAISLALAQTLPATARFSSGVQVTAKLEDALGIPLGDKPVVLTLGGAHALTWTDPVSGEATAVLPANAPPGHEYSVTASFAEDVGHLESTDTRTMYIDQAGSAFSPCQVPCDLDKSTVVATLFAHPGTPEERPINEQLVRIEFGQCGTVATHTDGRGRVVLFERLACTAPGTVRLIYDGDDRYAGTELCFSDAFDATGCPSGEQHNAPPSARIIRR